MVANNSCDQCVIDCKNMSDDLFPSEIFPALQEPGVAVYFLPGNVFPRLCDECSLRSHNHSSPAACNSAAQCIFYSGYNLSKPKSSKIQTLTVESL